MAIALCTIVVPLHVVRNSPGHVHAASPSRKVILFLSGVCSSMPRGKNIDDAGGTFGPLQTLLRNHYGYQSSDFMAYSYNGGFIDAAGVWTDYAYGKNDPQEANFTTTSYANLHNQIVQYETQNPNTSIVLVGHSLGGVVATEELRQDPSISTYVSKVITIDSPVRGVPTRVASDASYLSYLHAVPPCSIRGSNPGIGTATTLLVNRFNRSSTQTQLISSVRSAESNGVGVYNIGNLDDCLWEPSICLPLIYPSPVGDVTTQWIVGATQLKYSLLPASCPPTYSWFLAPAVALPLYFWQGGNCIGGSHSILLSNYTTLKGIADAIGTQTAPISPPTVASINPSSGPTAGGFAVTITGTNFTGATSIMFGSTTATSFTVNSPTQITAISPQGAVGTVDVTVTTPDGTSTTSSADQFTFISSPETLLPYNSSGYKYQVASYDQGAGFEQPGFDDSSWSSGTAGFGQPGFSYCPLDANAQTSWPLGTDLLVRQHFTLPVGTSSVNVAVAIDDYVQVFINGHDISQGLQPNPLHGCAAYDSLVLPVPPSDLVSGDNVIAVRARDVGVDDFLDVRIFTDS